VSAPDATTPSTTAAPRGVLGTDYHAHEWIIAIGLALFIQLASAVALQAAGLAAMAEAPDIDPGIAVPIAVRPVVDLDSPLLKLGGKKVKFKLPDRWIRQRPVKRVKRKAHVSTQAEDSEEAIPPEDLEISDAGTEPDPDAALAKEVDVELTEDSDAGPSNVEGEGHPDGVPEGTETDPLKARAVNLYHARILRFLTAPYRSQCASLSKEERTGCRPSATVQLSADGVVRSYSFNPCGKGPVDSAAKAALNSIKGQPIPPPPENYPKIRPNSFNVSYVCK
jgi:hypothetical protein